MYQLKNRVVMIGIHQQQYYACKEQSEMYSKNCGLQRLVIGNCGNSCNLSWKPLGMQFDGLEQIDDYLVV